MRAVLEKNQTQNTQKPELEIVESVPESHNQRSPSRRGKKMVACYLEPDAYRQMKILCAENDMNIERCFERRYQYGFHSIQQTSHSVNKGK